MASKNYRIEGLVVLDLIPADSPEDAAQIAHRRLRLLDIKGGLTGDDGHVESLFIGKIEEVEQ